MSKLLDAVIYILAKYPDHLSHEMSNARLTKMVYLSDWKHTLSNSAQITPIRWFFDNHGPFVRDVGNLANIPGSPIGVKSTTNMYGQPKREFNLREGNYTVDLTDAEIKSIESVIEETKTLYWNEFIKLVYSTHPIASSEKYTYLNLIEKAQEYLSD